MTLQTNFYQINLIYEYDAKSMTKCTVVENLNKPVNFFKKIVSMHFSSHKFPQKHDVAF